MILRDRLPPLEDLILGGEPGAIGAGCTLFVIIGGLFLLYRGLIDWHIPMLAALTAWMAFCILPIPVVITDMGTQWCWLALRPRYLGWPTALTLANYELLGSPLLFVAFFVATSPQTRPMSRRGRAVYGVALGVLSAVAQLYGSVAVGPYVAMLLISLASPHLDRLFKPKTLV
jgi:electron transport complex protein RnfD